MILHELFIASSYVVHNNDCEAGLPQLEALSLDRSAWREKVSSLT